MANRYINKANVRKLAIDYAKKSGRTKFKRVGQSFFDRIEGRLINAIQDEVNRHPSIGITIK